MKGLRLAVLGMGRSGIGAAQAASRLGAHVTVYDEKSADTDERMAELDALAAQGIAVVTGWHGRLAGEPMDTVLASPGFRRDHPALRDALGAGTQIWSEVEFAYQIAKAPIIAITGTNGKSTLTAMTYLILEAAGARPILCGNISGSGYPELTLTEAAETGRAEDVLVAEISSYQLEWVTEFRPRVATVTNVTPDHFDRHPHFQDYFDTKMRIFAQMGEGDVAVWNADELSVPKASIQSRGAEILAFHGGPSEPTAGLPTWSGQEIIWDGARFPLDQLPVLGTHNITNALQALCLSAAYLGSVTEDQKQAMLASLSCFQPLGHRMERLGSKSGVTIVNNSMCTNPGAVIASSKALSTPHTLLMGGVMKGLDFAPVGDYLRARPEVKVVLFSEFRDDLARSMNMEWPGEAGMDLAFSRAVEEARPGEIVMLAPGCASAYPYDNFRQRGEAFRALAKEWLES